MPTIHIIYDPTDKLSTSHPDVTKQLNLKIATLSITEGLIAQDIGDAAERLAKLLLEQMNLEEIEDDNSGK